MKRSLWLHYMILAGTVFCSGCTSTPTNPRDPLEPMNRAIYHFNDEADRHVVKPVATTYHNDVPSFVRTGVRNFFSNLSDASSSVNDALQAKPKASLYNASRFLLNSTVGVLGLIDVTGGHERNYPQTGFGDTFAVWGWKNSTYLVVPLLGPSTLRDSSGMLTGMAFQDDVIFNHSSTAVATSLTLTSGISSRERLLGIEDTINGAALDPYAYLRDAWLQMRAKQAGDTLPQKKDDDLDIDDLMK